MTFDRVAPSLRMNMASFSHVSVCPWQTAAAGFGSAGILGTAGCLFVLTGSFGPLHATVVTPAHNDGGVCRRGPGRRRQCCCQAGRGRATSAAVLGGCRGRRAAVVARAWEALAVLLLLGPNRGDPRPQSTFCMPTASAGSPNPPHWPYKGTWAWTPASKTEMDTRAEAFMMAI